MASGGSLRVVEKSKVESPPRLDTMIAVNLRIADVSVEGALFMIGGELGPLLCVADER